MSATTTLTSQLTPLRPADHYRFAKRLHLGAGTLRRLGAQTGSQLIIRPTPTAQNQFAIGIAWPSSELDEDAIGISLDHAISAGIQPGDSVAVLPLPTILPLHHAGPGRGIRLPEAREIRLTQIHPSTLSEHYQERIPPSQLTPHSTKFDPTMHTRLWNTFVFEVLVDRKYLAINHYIAIPFPNALQLFLIQDIQPISSAASSKPTAQSLELFVITRNTRLEITQLITNPLPLATTTTPPLPCQADLFRLHPQSAEQVGYDAIGGLEAQVEQIREMVELPLTRPELYSHFGLTPSKGILLYGPPGTGKTLLASIIAKSTRSTLLTLSTATISSAYHGEAEQKIYEIFREAKEKSPSIIVIDEIDGLFPNREEGSEVDRRMVGALLTCMDGLDQKGSSSSTATTMMTMKAGCSSSNSSHPPRVMVVATTNRPHTLDPALRRPGRLDRELEIGIPDATGRLRILQVLLRNVPHGLTAKEIKSVADKTHGFVGADLAALVREAGLGAIKRSLARGIPTPEMRLEADDLTQGLLNVQASGMRELYIETPRVTWADIGGQSEVKQRLVETLHWPSKYPDTFRRLGIKPVRGILLYGPPGCSKTLIAKALASESDMNFIAIKGSDLFHKFLGDSEKAIRDLFRKARAASPSVIFLDEIDSIAMARGSDEHADGGVGDRVLTSLLVEMDGIEELRGVLVLAATNRPEVIDPALMRPGRLDRILYVGPPDLQSRAEILAINFRNMAVDPAVDIQALAALTDGYTGAEIVAICQDAAINAIRRDPHAAFIVNDDLLAAVSSATKRTSPQLVSAYENWRDMVGVQSA
ncbi:hypothetical protein PCANC_10443 [Puccinia coronata f. sp. avenae]|uniref:AAA+ ATPase domain-containing protein n=1 Tax=Puccinia coronata f. sp. avenae TaxID=200324 RepID=A0A2N5VI89_9BASI|nr:hypothetical protein PCASD_12962 [Puccinia coronata f. sp. avenae]PLW49705.1 hypothetical protein PCANC_10443 [Puccinia coronata f. sp. avenae]